MCRSVRYPRRPGGPSFAKPRPGSASQQPAASEQGQTTRHRLGPGARSSLGKSVAESGMTSPAARRTAGASFACPGLRGKSSRFRRGSAAGPTRLRKERRCPKMMMGKSSASNSPTSTGPTCPGSWRKRERSGRFWSLASAELWSGARWSSCRIEKESGSDRGSRRSSMRATAKSGLYHR